MPCPACQAGHYARLAQRGGREGGGGPGLRLSIITQELSVVFADESEY